MLYHPGGYFVLKITVDTFLGFFIKDLLYEVSVYYYSLSMIDDLIYDYDKDTNLASDEQMR